MRTTFSTFLLGLWLVMGAFLFQGHSAEVPWVKAIDISSLTLEQAEENREVRIRGTVIFEDAPGAVFLQDETGGTFFRTGNVPPPKPGDIVEVLGQTRFGIYLPGLGESTFRIVGKGHLPVPKNATYDDLTSSRYHYQRVAIEGIVRSAQIALKDQTLLRVSMGSQIVEVFFRTVLPDLEKYIDSEVRVTGLAAGGINDRSQLVQPYIWPQSITEIEVIKPAPLESEIPRVSAKALLAYHPSGRTGHRVHVSGTVIAAFPDGQVYLRDDLIAFQARLKTSPSLKEGEKIEIIGFPEMEQFSASLGDAKLLKRQNGELPAPIPTDIKTLSGGSLDNNLVTVRATISDSFRTEKGVIVMLQNANLSLRVNIPELTETFQSGSLVQVTGVCQVESTRGEKYRSLPKSISLLARSATDVEILKKPSWWTTSRLTAALATLGIVLLLGALWIVILRRQVETQTSALRKRIENEAMLEERQRIAREFHDTLEQNLTGLSLHLGAAAARGSDERGRSLLDTARHLVSGIQTETRNLLSDLRTPPDQMVDLATALNSLTQKHTGECGPRVVIHAKGDSLNLPSRIVHHLRMIAQEATTNALKHAQANVIDITLEMKRAELQMTITDNGVGFDAAQEAWEKPGHFGCMGIRERCRKLGATVNWQSSLGNGTRVEVSLPISEIDKK